MSTTHFCSAMPIIVEARTRKDGTRGRDRAVFLGQTRWETGETIKIAFVDGNAAQRAHVQKVGQKWTRYANLVFEWNVPIEESDVRIAFKQGAGSWSYLGAQNRGIPKDKPTMNLGWEPENPALTDNTSTIWHEFGHMLGLAHEHMNPNIKFTWNREEVIKSLSGPPNNWSVATIEANVFNKIPANTPELVATEFDAQSIMLYGFPASWTNEGISAPSSNRISVQDKLIISQMYPGTGWKEGDVSEDDGTTPPPPTKCSCFGNALKEIGKAIAQRFKK